MSASIPPDPSSTTVPAPATTTRLFSNPLPPQRDSFRTLPQQHLLQPHPNSLPRHHNIQPVYANQRLHTQPQSTANKPQIQDPHQGILYPVAASSRGFLPRPIPQHHNHHQYVPIAISSARTNPAAYPYQVRPLGVPLSDPLNQAMHLVRPNNTNLHQSLLGSTAVAVPNVVRRVPVSAHPKVVPPSSAPNSNGIKDIRERSKDDDFATLRDRKVRLSEGSSLYRLCRSWMNSISEENQPRYNESVKSLPKPLPANVADANSEVNMEDDKEEENVKDVENLTPKELLQRHIKRAKKARGRLRENRLQRIARYKGRLALLLPPLLSNS